MKKTTVEKHFDQVAQNYDNYTKKRDLHYSSLKKLLASLIHRNKKVFEIGCGTGDLIAFLHPKYGYGLDISSEMVKRAKVKYKNENNLYFSKEWPKQKFDYIFMSDVIEHLEDPKAVLNETFNLMQEKTVFINTMMNPVWIPVETLYNLLGWKMPEGPHYRMRYGELKVLVQDCGMKIIKHDYKLLMPIKIPLITDLVNNHLEKYLKRLAFIEYFVAVKV